MKYVCKFKATGPYLQRDNPDTRAKFEFSCEVDFPELPKKGDPVLFGDICLEVDFAVWKVENCQAKVAHIRFVGKHCLPVSRRSDGLLNKNETEFCTTLIANGWKLISTQEEAKWLAKFWQELLEISKTPANSLV